MQQNTQTNLEYLAKMTSEMATTLPSKLTKRQLRQSMSPEDVDQIVSINPSGIASKQPLSPGNTGIDAGIDLSKTLTSSFIPDVYTMYGYSIPKNTLYLIIVLIIVGVALWYMTSNSKKKSEKTILENDDKEKDHKDRKRD